jgi:nucleotide-binding universal stress UspA family protein
MMAATQQHTIRHIVATLDASESGLPALQAAVRLAAVTGAGLEGVFVEDINLIRLSGLPFLREVRSWSLAEEAISMQRMQRELHTLARHAERMLEQAAGELGVPWSFQVWRGRAGAASLAQAFGADILSLPPVCSLFSSRVRDKKQAIERHPGEVEASISVLFSDTEQAVRALTIACSLARDMGARLIVLLPEIHSQDLATLKNKALAILELHGQTAQFARITGTDVRSLVRAAGAPGRNTLITEAEHPLLQQIGLEQCLQALFRPVLLVR